MPEDYNLNSHHCEKLEFQVSNLSVIEQFWKTYIFLVLYNYIAFNLIYL